MYVKIKFKKENVKSRAETERTTDAHKVEMENALNWEGVLRRGLWCTSTTAWTSNVWRISTSLVREKVII